MNKKITTPLTEEKIKDLKAGDSVLISGIIYTARDAAHKRLIERIEKGEELPFDVTDQIIYYVGPTPAKGNQPIGSAGPTSSYRMDSYAPKLIEKGLRGMIGKGKRNKEVIEAMKKYGAVYFAAIGGAAALTAKCVKSAKIIAYEDLGAEAIRKLEVEDLPVVVVIDAQGNNYYEIGQKEYLETESGC
ncbi:Fe-S-containing hydro-lyase [Garciella nitratireducens]|uniref:Fumarate hydratase subunit beta n=1 Tax=Garciella nitratireducens DSM 15102 TaxID=1121911 RepID=A0A1T4P4N6_9FIRM|nr:Fe-S-containing hydro-lyase [Garciella nitratireducens]RBP46965.1 fumarate hydratase subunit beta [Garciella nitratireducens]SJZ86474.1 fumarate hydratase subunit beta [Garciella nitratireducens DSM 15102]